MEREKLTDNTNTSSEETFEESLHERGNSESFSPEENNKKKRFYLAFVGEIAREKKKENVCAVGFFIYELKEFRSVRSYVVASEEDLPVDREFLNSSPKIIESTVKYLKEKSGGAYFSLSDVVYGKLLNLFTPYFISTAVAKVENGEDLDDEREKIVEILSEIFRTRISVSLTTGFLEEEIEKTEEETESESSKTTDTSVSKVILRGAPLISPTHGIPAEELETGDVIKLKLVDVPEDLEKAISDKVKRGDDFYLGSVSAKSLNEETGNVRLECYLGNNIYAVLSVNPKTKISTINRKRKEDTKRESESSSFLSPKDYVILAGVVLFLVIFLWLLLR